MAVKLLIYLGCLMKQRNFKGLPWPRTFGGEGNTLVGSRIALGVSRHSSDALLLIGLETIALQT